jgi:threonine/homoserine/homoserine lactone efflux protein
MPLCIEGRGIMNVGLLPFLAFAIVASATPGPNNIMVMATAATYGLRATVPLILGVALGFGFMVAVIGLGIARPLAAHSTLHEALRWVGAAWLLLLAWKIARAKPLPEAAEQRRAGSPVGFWAAWGLQWVNPKAWVMALATVTTYTTPGCDLTFQVLVLAAILVLVSLPAVGGWALLGAHARRHIRSPRRMRIFNLVMGLLLATSVIPAVLE